MRFKCWLSLLSNYSIKSTSNPAAIYHVNTDRMWWLHGWISSKHLVIVLVSADQLADNVRALVECFWFSGVAQHRWLMSNQQARLRLITHINRVDASASMEWLMYMSLTFMFVQSLLIFMMPQIFCSYRSLEVSASFNVAASGRWPPF